MSDDYAMLMRPNKAETAFHGCHCPGDLAVRMRNVMTVPRSWCSVLCAVYSSIKYFNSLSNLNIQASVLATVVRFSYVNNRYIDQKCGSRFVEFLLGGACTCVEPHQSTYPQV